MDFAEATTLAWGAFFEVRSPGEHVVALVRGCPPEYQNYMSICTSSTLAMLRDPDTRNDDGVCDHVQFACFFGSQAGDACRQRCPIGVAFALYSLLISTMQSGEFEDARRLLLYLVHLADLLPPSCRGGDHQLGCHPVLPVGWMVGAQTTFDQALQFLGQRELKPVQQIERHRNAGRSIAVVTAYYFPSNRATWRLQSDVRLANTMQSDSERPRNASGTKPTALMHWYVENKRCYAERHGYSFVFDQRAPRIELNANEDGYEFGIHWVKFAAVRDALRLYDWVFWIDFDALFANFSLSLEEMIDVVDKTASADLIVQHGSDLVNPNAFLLRSSSWSFHFLDQWESFGRQVVRGRSRMWELRCFNCAVVNHILVKAVGAALRGCGEHEAHVVILKHLLEKHGFDYASRQQLRSIGRIYFWDPATHMPRGFLFNVNNKEQQAHFHEVELYHPGDLALHWPKPDKDTLVMRDFANEIPGGVGCARWTQPLIALDGVYQPTGVASDGPPLFEPRHVLAAAAEVADAGSVAVRVVGQEDFSTILGPILQAFIGTYDVVDVLLGRSPRADEESEWAGAEGIVRLRTLSSISELPANKLYDFMYLGIHSASEAADSLQEEADFEVSEAMSRLRPGGVLAMPLDQCGDLELAAKPRYTPPTWCRFTRSVGATGSLNGCRWAYCFRRIKSNDNYNIWRTNQAYGAMVPNQ
eukprot:TRINITY_DN61058_c0_g1_i1.p1 TRINITY_DN61058_c0_g1~~TRINITY_DN61058_c0_g1_i1.p1  ORF type:complete len:701 (+),score=78.61 TRINITY_DN61058_c0_g1_i1:60-2162(+)